MAPPSPQQAVSVAPARYFCPITTELMADPVMDRHGHNFERTAILGWLARHAECPMSRCPISPEDLFPNLALKEDIAHWLADHPNEKPESDSTLKHSLPPTAEAQASLASKPFGVVSTPAVIMFEQRQLQQQEEAMPWLRLNIPQEEYDVLVTLFYSICAPSGTLTLVEAQRLLCYMNYHNALDALTTSEATMSLPQFVTFCASHRPCPTDYGLSGAEYKSIVQRFRELDVAGRGVLDKGRLRALCNTLNMEDLPAGLPEGSAALVTCHDFLLRLREARTASLAADTAATTVATRGRAASFPLMSSLSRSNRSRPLEWDASAPRQSPKAVRVVPALSPQLSFGSLLAAAPPGVASPRTASPRLQPAASPRGAPLRRISSETLAFPIRSPKASGSPGSQHPSPRNALWRVAGDLSGGWSPPPSPSGRVPRSVGFAMQ